MRGAARCAPDLAAWPPRFERRSVVSRPGFDPFRLAPSRVASVSRAPAFVSATSSSDFCCNEHDRGHYPVREWVPRDARPRVRAAEPSGDCSPSGMPGRSPVIRCPLRSTTLPPSIEGAASRAFSAHERRHRRRTLDRPDEDALRRLARKGHGPSGTEWRILRERRRAPTRRSARAPRGHRDGPCGRWRRPHGRRPDRRPRLSPPPPRRGRRRRRSRGAFRRRSLVRASARLLSVGSSGTRIRPRVLSERVDGSGTSTPFSPVVQATHRVVRRNAAFLDGSARADRLDLAEWLPL